MPYRYLAYVAIASVSVVMAAFLAVSPGNDQASASDVEFVWGNWRCASEPMSPSNITTILRHVEEMEEPSTIGCSPLGEIVADDVHGDLIWGDTNCDGGVNVQDALAQVLWYADLAQAHANCPNLGDSIANAPAANADWHVDSVDYEVPVTATGDTISTNGRVDVTVKAGNLGPDTSAAGLFFAIDVPSSQAGIRFIPLSGDTCFDLTPQQIPCSEGNPGSDPTVDFCFDGEDNDGDQLEDFDDPDCGQVRTLRESILLSAGPGAGTYERSFTIFCSAEGPLSFDISVRVEPVDGVTDPVPSNNSLDRTIAVTCVS